MAVKLTDRITRIKPSLTIAVTNKAQELKQQGFDIISLGAGEPDFDTPDFIKNAAINAINNGQTKYTAVDGTPELKTAIVNKFKTENNLNYGLDQILVSCGAKHSIYNLACVLLEDGDEALIPCPYWVSYPAIVELVDAKPVFIETKKSDKYKLTAEQLEQSISDKTKLLFLNSPSNPSGQVYTKNELLALAKVLLKHPNVFIMTDDIYEHIVFNNIEYHNILSACQSELSAEDYSNLYERTIVINGVSKAYSMTGWRIGYAAGNKDIIKAMKKLQSQNTSNPCSISQAAATEALANPESRSAISHMVAEFKKRHDYIYEVVNSSDKLSTIAADGAFYSFIDCTDAIKHKGYKDDIEFAEALLTEKHLAMVSGTAFGNPNHLRLSYATSMSVLEEAMSRLLEFVK